MFKINLNLSDLKPLMNLESASKKAGQMAAFDLANATKIKIIELAGTKLH